MIVGLLGHVSHFTSCLKALGLIKEDNCFPFFLSNFTHLVFAEWQHMQNIIFHIYHPSIRAIEFRQTDRKVGQNYGGGLKRKCC